MTVFTLSEEQAQDLERAVMARGGKGVGRGEIRFRCPAHSPDVHPSARYNRETHVWTCDTCKEGGGFFDLGRRLSVEFDRSTATRRRQIVAEYPYTDESGELLYEVVRFSPKDFRQRRPAGNGAFTYRLDGVRRVPYNLPEVRAVAEVGWRVYIAEGEKDCDAGNALGLCFTTNAGGAGKWRDEFSDALRGAEVVVIADKDVSGRNHALDVARSCSGRAKTVRVLELPGEDVKDLSDWLSAGGTKAELERLANEAPEWTARPNGEAARKSEPDIRRREYNGNELVTGAVDGSEIIYLSFLGQPGYIVDGWSHLLAGYPRSGKTELLVRLIREWLDAGMRILFITEESLDLWRKRLARQRGDWSGLQVLLGLGVPTDELRARAFDGIENVVVLDAMRNLLQLKDENDNSEIAREVNPWIVDARRTAKTFIAAHHNRKGGGEHGEGIAGGHALLGAFDVGLELLRTNSAQPRRRTVRTYSRVVSPAEFVYELADDGTMRVLGAPAEVALEGVSARVIEEVTPEWRTTKEIFGSLGDPKPSEEQVRKALVQAATDRKIQREPPIDQEAKGKTHRWREFPIEPPPPTEGESVGGEVSVASSPRPTEPPTDSVQDEEVPTTLESARAQPPTEPPSVGSEVGSVLQELVGDERNEPVQCLAERIHGVGQTPTCL